MNRIPTDFLRPSAVSTDLTFSQSMAQRLVRWLYMVGKGFVSDQCLLRASALAYTTVLSLVPLLAVAFSISKGFGFQNSEFIYSLLMQITAGREEIVVTIVGYINNTKVSTLGVVGVGLLFFTVISLLGNIEASFNSIWGVKAQRNLWRKFSDYLTVTLICPVLIIVAISATASLENSAFMQTLLSVSVFANLYIFLLKMVPFFSTWAALMFIYTFIPNTRVKIGAALGGAVIAGSLWQIIQILYIQYQSASTNYNAIYGSFAQVPLFLIWMFISWTIVLLGAEISFALQNSETYYRESRMQDYSFDDRQKLAAMALAILTRTFMDGGKHLTNEEMANRLNAPVKLVNDVMFMLEASGLVVRIGKPEMEAYTLNRPPDSIRLLTVNRALARFKEHNDEAVPADVRDFVDPLFEGLGQAVAASPDNLTLSQFADRCLGRDICGLADSETKMEPETDTKAETEADPDAKA